MSKFYKDLKKSFEDILAYRKGEVALCSKIIRLSRPSKPQNNKSVPKDQVKP